MNASIPLDGPINLDRTRRGVTAFGLVCALLWLAAAPALAWASPPKSPDRIVTGDLIVKFRDATEHGKVLAAVVAGTSTVAAAMPLAKRLSGELGVPLVLVQVTSGREALLAVDRKALLDELAQRARREPGVARAQAEPAARTVLPPDAAALRIEWKARAADAAAQARAGGLAGNLASGDLLRPTAQAMPGGDTLLTVDLAAMTLALIEKLKQREDVEYAQANRVLRAIGSTPTR